ncbi:MULTISPECIES: hypothetical protein [Leuconostoc]|uniref:Uncharacterized protein n=2 Tax=Leuconostoc kimchii TaxID=136609 RepID=D5T511_LEUKI|nr:MULTISPECIES: hypothetical protein [Leuconostoc]ADG41163.1 hypothetical protein LKI_08120 [Leuconostoc kimchii IMSNU 11154]AEJ30861.1 hypothetical protein LGMK_04015 [Leuconostoc sp. C2]QBR47964.1 hypothetical protein EW139_07430 [Leuconostoc kimchii]
MQRLERVLPTFVFVVMLGSNLINASHLSVSVIFMAVIMAAISGLIIFGLIKLLTWWLLH